MKPGSWITRTVFLALAGGAVLLVTMNLANAATAPTLGTAEPFAVLAGTTITNTGLTTITGDIGVSPGSAITDSGTITLTGAPHVADAAALNAQNDVITAYDALGSEPCTASFVGTDVEIGSQALLPGVYCYSSSALLTGTLTLNGDGVYIFKMGSTLTTASGSTVALIGAQPCNVYWQIGSSADLFSTTTFVGNIIALTSINLQTGASLAGRALARNGAVTLDTNTITSPSCALAPTATATATNTAVPAATVTATMVPSATATATSVATPPTATTGAGTPTNTPGPGTPTVTPGLGTPTITPGPGTPTAAIGTPTPRTGAPPASPIETPDFGSPEIPRLPNAGSGTPGDRSAPWSLALLAVAIGSLTLASGWARYQRSVR